MEQRGKRVVGRPFKPGQSGNPKGRPKARLFDESLRQVLATKNGAKAKELAAKLVEKALTGNVPALKLIADRIGGPPRPPEGEKAPITPASTPQAQRQKLIEMLRSPELQELLREALTPEKGQIQ